MFHGRMTCERRVETVDSRRLGKRRGNEEKHEIYEDWKQKC